MAAHESCSPYSSLAETLRGLLRRLDAQQNLNVYRLWLDWEKVVGPQIARRVRPLEFRNGVLLLVAASSIWRQELEFLKAELLQQIRSYLEDDRVCDLAIVVGKVSDRGGAAASSTKALHRQLHLPPLEPLNCERALAQVQDPALAKALRRLCEARERFRLQLSSDRSQRSSG